MKNIHILGIRGIPAQHGGFETFAEKLALHLTSSGWKVSVYCQEDGPGTVYETEWERVHRIHVPVKQKGPLGTIVFDLRSVQHSLSQPGLLLTLGYNTAVFNVLQRLKGQVNVINMDGIEWRRAKWGKVAKTWFWLNERAGCWIGNHLVADHPEIKAHLATRVRDEKITMIPYGGDGVLDADEAALSAFNLRPGKFSVIIARPEPENSFLEMVRAFSAQKRDHNLVVLGKFSPATNGYHRAVMAAASDEVIFPGAIYETRIVQALRFFCRFYLHGHQVGGTNPSLVEALGASSAVIAHDNRFNRWVAGPDAAYFSDATTCSQILNRLLDDDTSWLAMKEASRKRFKERFTWEQILSEYEALLTKWHSISSNK